MLHAALQAVVGDLAGVVQVQQASVSRGIFDAAELARQSIKAPALLVHCRQLDPGDYAGGDSYEYSASLRLYVIVRDKLGSPRLEQALDEIVEPLLGAIPGRTWGGAPWTGAAPHPVATSQYSTTIDSQGLALWTLDWAQTLRLPRLRQA